MSQNPVNEHLEPIKRPRLECWSWKSAVLLAVILLVVCSYLNPRNMSYVCYYLDWHHWPYWYSVNLWILAVGAAVNYFVQRKNIRAFLYVGVLGAISVVTAFYSTWLHILAYRISCFFKVFYYSVCRPYFYAPIVELFSDGTVTARLFVAPVSALGLMMFILICRCAIRQCEKAKSKGT